MQDYIINAICKQCVLEEDVDYIPEESTHEYLIKPHPECGYKD